MTETILSLSQAGSEIIRVLGVEGTLITRSELPDAAVPDIVVTEEPLTEDDTALIGGKPEVLNLTPPASVDDVCDNILSVGSHFGISARAEALVEELQERTEIVRHKLKFVADRPDVVCITGLQPLRTADTLISGLIEIAGGKPVLQSEPGNLTAAGKLTELNPGVIIVAVPGLSIEQTLKEINSLISLPGWTELKAVADNRIYIADGNFIISSGGPQMADTLEMIAEIVQPGQFIFGFEGTGWVKFVL